MRQWGSAMALPIFLSVMIVICCDIMSQRGVW